MYNLCVVYIKLNYYFFMKNKYISCSVTRLVLWIHSNVLQQKQNNHTKNLVFLTFAKEFSNEVPTSNFSTKYTGCLYKNVYIAYILQNTAGLLGSIYFWNLVWIIAMCFFFQFYVLRFLLGWVLSLIYKERKTSPKSSIWVQSFSHMCWRRGLYPRKKNNEILKLLTGYRYKQNLGWVY